MYNIKSDVWNGSEWNRLIFLFQFWFSIHLDDVIYVCGGPTYNINNVENYIHIMSVGCNVCIISMWCDFLESEITLLYSHIVEALLPLQLNITCWFIVVVLLFPRNPEIESVWPVQLNLSHNNRKISQTAINADNYFHRQFISFDIHSIDLTRRLLSLFIDK
jgi:hypothetical protein